MLKALVRLVALSSEYPNDRTYLHWRGEVRRKRGGGKGWGVGGKRGGGKGWGLGWVGGIHIARIVRMP